jgi:hypothetical protein
MQPARVNQKQSPWLAPSRSRNPTNFYPIPTQQQQWNPYQQPYTIQNHLQMLTRASATPNQYQYQSQMQLVPLNSTVSNPQRLDPEFAEMMITSAHGAPIKTGAESTPEQPAGYTVSKATVTACIIIYAITFLIILALLLVLWQQGVDNNNAIKNIQVVTVYDGRFNSHCPPAVCNMTCGGSFGSSSSSSSTGM